MMLAQFLSDNNSLESVPQMWNHPAATIVAVMKIRPRNVGTSENVTVQMISIFPVTRPS